MEVGRGVGDEPRETLEKMALVTMGGLVVGHLLSAVFRGLLRQKRGCATHVLYTAIEGWAMYRDRRDE